MGREIRRVPSKWDHPRSLRPSWDRLLGRPTQEMAYTPLVDHSLREVQEEWDERKRAWEAGEDEARERRWTQEDYDRYADRTGGADGIVPGELIYDSYEDYNGARPPYYRDDDTGELTEHDCYRPDWPESERTAFQVYETVSEGTPVSPVFQTQDDLTAWLVDPSRNDERLPHMSREAAERFIEHGSVPSLMIAGGVIASNVEMLEPAFRADDS